MVSRIKIAGTGSFLPPEVVTNADISNKGVDTTDEWIQSRTGIKERRITSQTTSQMSIEAARLAIQSAVITPQEIDMVVVATTTPDLTFPSVACLVQGALGIKRVPAFDFQAACAGFVYGLFLCQKIMFADNLKNILLIGADKMSSLINWQDRTTCILFGDGAGAVVLTKEDSIGNSIDNPSAIIDSEIFSDPDFIEILRTDDGISTNGVAGHIKMLGQQVFKQAVTKMAQMIQNMLKKNNLTIQDINFVIPHQANNRITQSVVEKLGLSPSQAISTVEKHGNTSAASIPLALDYGIKSGKIKKGDLVVFVAIGAGLTSGCSICRI